MALHALAYCERLFYLEEVEEIRIADASVYAGRTLHEHLREAEEESGEWSSRELASINLGLTGKVDCLRRRDGSLIPYEHKRGHAHREDDKVDAWPSDALQVSAYGMLLEEETGQKIKGGRVRYHADNVTVRVPLDETARDGVRAAVARAKELIRLSKRPPVTDKDYLCAKCSLAPVCLPEEERFISDPTRKPVRLFPAEKELKTLHVTENGAYIARSGDTIKIETKEGERRVYPVREVGSIVLHGYPQITTQALHFCVYNNIAIHWLSGGQHYVTGITPGAGAVQRKLRQYLALSDPGMCLSLARRLVTAKIEGALRYVLRATRGTKRSDTVVKSIAVIRRSLKQVVSAESVDELRGHEGIAGRAYFAAIPDLLHDTVPEGLCFSGRSRRPPRDCFNALLGFGYALLYQAMMQAVLAVGLEPALGFFHAPRSSAHPLVLDMMELFRIPIWDIVLVGSLNRLQWDADADFSVTGARVWLSDSGRKKAIKLFEQRLDQTWKHPVIGYSLSYARMLELEVRLLEKEWTGSPGLFARMRLR
ncbi:type I-MYXAN CRISPR-associated endonuclease Cas1 [candidate division WOR-3 bacterium]|nr:type I-MYXAN CRISPR-associated endonuclease Cas1 [candidate division WOR-3 bacterium]